MKLTTKEIRSDVNANIENFFFGALTLGATAIKNTAEFVKKLVEATIVNPIKYRN